MLLILKSNDSELGLQAAQLIAHAVRKNPELRLGLATGTTMVGMYEELVRLHHEERLSFSGVVTFNLDEYLGLSATHPHSFHCFMRRHFFDHVDVQSRNIHMPDGAASGDYIEYCRAYEDAIRNAGGIDLQVLGIGRNGHVGFNEPTSSLGSRTRLKVLSQETMHDNRSSFGLDTDIPECAITMGIGTILEARRIVLLASGAAKAEAVAKAIEGPVSASVTASALQMHPDVTFVVDQDAGSLLKQKEYYQRVLEMTSRLTPDRL